MATAPQMFDFTKMVKDFDPTKMVDELSKMMKQYNLPGVDIDSLVASRKKDLEALGTANRVAFEGLQAVAKRQTEILQETMNAASKAVDTISKAGSPQDIAAKQAEIAKEGFEKALSNMRELAELVTKANQEATTAINARISASLDELKDLVMKLKQG